MPSSDFNRIPKFPATIPSDQQQQQQQQENLSCPRCDSTNTKFCYYNNYNFSQPRHFCKSCRRYWTHGGTLRDIPVGGVSRKSSKRSKISVTTTTTAATTASSVAGTRNFPLQATPVLFPPPSTNGVNTTTAAKNHHPHHQLCSLLGYNNNNNNNNAVRFGPNGEFINGLNDGFGLGLGPGSYFDDVRFGSTGGGITVWPFSSTGGVGGVGVAVPSSVVADATTVTTTTSHVAPLPATWQFVSGGDYN